MAKRNTGKKKVDYNPMKMEKEMAKIHRLINEQNFESKKDLENYLNNIMGDKINEFKTKSNPKYEAQDLVYEAYELPENKGKKLIERALKIDPNNADAYVYLAEIEEDNHKALEFYEKGVKAGKKSLGEEVFKEDAGHFWGIFETRPYMRARVGYAECLYLIGRCNEAIDQYKDMLKLNPNDNQGIRFHLSTWLIDQNRKNDYLKLYHKFNDEISAHWLFNHVLFLFKTIGKVKKTSIEMRKAIDQNPFAIPYLVGEKDIPETIPEYMGFGDENEAIYYWIDAAKIWYNDRKAMEWLFEVWERHLSMN